MDPQQELFTQIRMMLVRLFGEDKVYDSFLPPDGTPYPFVYLADSWEDDDANKSAVFGMVTQTVHVWHNDPHKRGTVSSMMMQIKQEAQKLGNGAWYAWDYRNPSQRIISDSTTAQPLLHGVIELHFYFS